MSDSYLVVNARSASGAGLGLSLYYANYNADGEHASLNTVMGYGWSHSYNVFLFTQGRDLFKMSPGGITTKYERAARTGALTATRGHQQTVIENPDGSIEIRNNNGGLIFRFEKIPGNPISILGTIPWMLKRITDRNGNVTELTYGSGLLNQVQDTYVRKITFTYDTNKRLRKITDPMGRVTSLSYDALRNLSSISDPLGKTQSYTYNARHQIVTKKDKNGGTWRYEYNATGHPTGVVDQIGNPLLRLTNPSDWATDLNALFLNKQRSYVPSVTTRKDGRGNTWQYSYDKNGHLTKVVAPDGAPTVYTYDDVYDPAHGKYATLNRATETDANGNTKRYEYDALGKLTKVTDALNFATLYEYMDAACPDKPTRITYPNGAITDYAYDAKCNRMQEIRDSGGLNLTSTWTYYGDGTVKTETDPNSHTKQYFYDSYGNLAEVIDPEGCTTQYDNDILGNRTRMIDGNGNVTVNSYDALSRLVMETDPLGFTTAYKYDGNSNRIEVKKQVTKAPDPETFQVTTYQYDVRNRLIQETRDPGGLNLVTKYTYDNNNNRITVIDPRNKVTTYEYDAQNRVTKVTDALNNMTQTRYDGAGNLICLIDANGHYIFNEYDPLNRLVSESKKIGTQECTTGDSDDLITQYFHDTNGAGGCPSCGGPTPGSGNILKIIDPEGKVSCFKYDKVDRRKATIRKVGDIDCSVVDSDDWVEFVDYDPVGNVLKRIDANGNPTTLTYYLNNWLKTQTNPEGETTSYTHDCVGNMKTVTVPGGNVTTNTYNAKNQLVQVDDLVGRVANYAYDGVGSRKTDCDANGNCRVYAYDAVNRLIALTDAMSQTAFYTYDQGGNLIQATDREGKVTCYQYDDINRRILTTQKVGDTNCAVVGADDIWTKSHYDPVGNIVSLTTAKKGSTPAQCNIASPPADCESTSYLYDEVNRVITETYPDAGVRSFTYDGAGNLKSRTDQMGRTTKYQYAELYYLTLRDYVNDPDDSFAYDTGGRMLRAERGGWVVTFAYDKANRVTQTTQNGQPVDYVYDTPNRCRTLTYPGGKVVEECRDWRDRLDDINAGSIATYGYDPGNRVTSRSYGNGVVATYEYNQNNWITKLEHRKADTTLIAGFGYSYDKEGNKKHGEKEHHPARSEAYEYDDIYRLIDYKVGQLVGSTVPVPVTQTQYDLDKLGNWDSKVKDGVTQNRTHSAVNEITAIDGAPIIYDENGNLIENGNYFNAYDEENRLTGVTRKADSRLVGQYQYDALSRRTAKTAAPDPMVFNPVTTLYFYDDARIIEEQDTAGLTQATYVYGNYIDEILTMERGGQTYYYHQNALWSAAAVTDSTTDVVERYDYDAYGCVVITDSAGNLVPVNPWGTPHSAVGNPWMFTGRQLDEETGLYYYRARYYNCEKGRFLQRDPLGYVDGLNLYRYVRSNPVKLVDPFGETWKVIRKNRPRAEARGEKGDTISDLASLIRLNANESEKWLIPPKPSTYATNGCESFSIPNTGYIDVSSYTWAFLGWYLMGYKDGLQARWQGEGLYVAYTGPWSTTVSTIISHLKDPNLYKYAYIGHGEAGCMTSVSNPDSFVVDPKMKEADPTIICADAYTRFHIAEMHIIACKSNDSASKWKLNVSDLGFLRTVKGYLTTYSIISSSFVDE